MRLAPVHRPMWLLLLAVGIAALASWALRRTRAPRATPCVEITRRLADGSLCHITLGPARAGSTARARLESVRVRVRGQESRVSPDVLADLPDVHVPDGIQVAEFADELYLLLSGGEGPAAWQAKLTIRDGRVTAREVTRAGQTAEAAFFQAPTVTVVAAGLPVAAESSGSLHLLDAKHIRAEGASP